ncbi:ScbA/BarX family gamma-butyrolactone biosynthesis protein [Antrihabitans sp. YC2-6]|uniref:ScbA/BarX family gamma-butyrolactone biosynthesis protein n=1 Tax=Antrihabitans sp. YC2-6 TaxID=2799498 RepID=UPI0018F2CFA3|nr:ScbA/BarX family gamma-butyrolactone biosynthesis protein [Antrihabitans sp. YC2-6]MBJ8345384.1 gamma-butyrolactone biosynthesis protein [Antrihabitans sp. YC2-6]
MSERAATEPTPTEPTVAELLHGRTISRDIVHRASIAEVFVTSLHKLRDDEYVTTAQLPRSHAYYCDHIGELGRSYDPMMVMEAARQSGMAVVHRFFDVPTGRAFLLRTFNGRSLSPDAWKICSTPADLSITVAVKRIFHTEDLPTGMAVQLDVRRGGEPMMSVDSKFSWIPRPVWDALRHQARSAVGLSDIVMPLPPGQRARAALVGRESQRNVVIAEPKIDGNTATATLVCDVDHPTIFDHPVDHVPGSLQIEACRQLGWALLAARTSGAAPRTECVKSTFTGFLELDRPSDVTAEIIDSGVGDTLVACTIRQSGRPAAEFVVGYTLPNSEL